MVRTADTLEAQLLRLPAPDRARLAELLLDSLDPPGAEDDAEIPADEADRLWAAEATRRLDELRAGAVAGVPAAEVFARLAQRYGA